MADLLPGPAVTVMLAGHVIVGGVESTYVTCVVHVLLKLLLLVTVIVIVYVPGLFSTLPAVGFCVITNWPDGVQLSVAVTSPTTLGIIAWQLALTGRVLSAGQWVIAGALDWKTLNGTTHVVLLLEASVTVTVMGCEPTDTTVPAEGLWLISSEAVGVQLSVATTSSTTFGIVP